MRLAPLYSNKEKAIHIAIAATLVGGLTLFYHLWFADWIERSLDQLQCYEWRGLALIDYVLTLYVLIIPLPLLAVGLFMLPTGLRAFRECQFPPEGQKTYHPTIISWNLFAKTKAIVHIVFPFIVLAIIGLTLWQTMQIEPIDKATLDYTHCNPIPTFAQPYLAQ